MSDNLITEVNTYNETWHAWHESHAYEYRSLHQECTDRQREIRLECEAGRRWSEAADTARWFYDRAIMRLQVLDRAGHQAAEAAIAARTLSELAEVAR